jgi:mono/diheme cytochrome c family protein
VFIDKGCGGCHEFQPADSSGTTGPELNDLQMLAEGAGQPLDEFVRSSITQPNAYVEQGFPEGVMPAWSGTEEELNDLVAFLTQ